MKIINRFSHITILLFVAGVMFIEGCKKNEDIIPDTGRVANPTPAAPDKTSRDSIVLDYNTNYVGSNVVNPGWTGSTSNCNSGTVFQSTHDAVIKRINYFRRLVGLNDNCTLDATKFAQEQQAALMMKANNSLSHTPPTSWSCYTSEGASGAYASNIALGAHSTTAVTAFIKDDGTGNEPVGHRRWILRAAATTFSYGTTDVSMALYVFGAGGNTKVPTFIAYPPKGYVPQQLIVNRWSFSIPSANFSAATVTMTGPNGNVPVSVISNNMVGYGDNTIVWVPQGINTTSTEDIPYTVTVSGVSNSSQSSYTYTVTVIKP